MDPLWWLECKGQLTLSFPENPFLKWICFLWCGVATVVCMALPKLIEENNVNPAEQVRGVQLLLNPFHSHTWKTIITCVQACRVCSLVHTYVSSGRLKHLKMNDMGRLCKLCVNYVNNMDCSVQT